MSEPIDLNKLREKILANRARGQDTPSDPGAKLFVHKGKIVDRPGDIPERELSEIQQGTFASTSVLTVVHVEARART